MGLLHDTFPDAESMARIEAPAAIMTNDAVTRGVVRGF
jgi:hypothetical protein